MKHAAYSLLSLLLLTACAEPVIDSTRTETIYDNRLRIVSGTSSVGRFISVENVARHWSGRMEGGKEKWGGRQRLLQRVYNREIETICGKPFYQTVHPAIYQMMDKDETMGGVAPVLGITASMIAHLAADAATDDGNVPVGVYIEFRCPRDENNQY